MKTRKVHRSTGRSALCGGHNVAHVSDDQFVWLPREVQCDRCAIKTPHLPRGEDRIVNGIPVVWVACATAEMQTTVETIVLAIHRIWQYEHEHRCWFDDVRKVCTCGEPTWLDPNAERRVMEHTLEDWRNKQAFLAVYQREMLDGPNWDEWAAQ